jgi:hypothetical protein
MKSASDGEHRVGGWRQASADGPATAATGVRRRKSEPQPHADVERKIAALFAERQIEQLIAIAEPAPANRGSVLRALWEVQRAIYALDDYGESTWSLSTAELKKRWTAIEAQVARFVSAGAIQRALLAELATYRDVEIARRSGTEVTAIGISEFYRLKACDLRLARNLIGVLTGYRSSAEANSLWPICEIAGEICDDLADLEEDCGTYNANRVAVALSTRPTAVVVAEYSNVLRSLTSPVSSSFSYDDAEATLVADAILRHCETAYQLLGSLASLR